MSSNKMSDLDKILTKFVRRFEKVGRQQAVGIIMMQLMVLQLDGQVEISNDTMRLYLDALEGTVKKVDAFRKHCVERYFT